MSECDDWAPLPPSELTRRPGELDRDHGAAAVRDDRAPAPRTRAGDGRCAHQEGSPAAALAWSTLCERLAGATSRDPVAAAINRSLRASERRQRALCAPFVADAAPVRSSLQGPDEVPSANALAQADPRERESWFTALPPAEQARLRARWTYDRTRFAGWFGHCLRQRAALLARGVLVFTVVGVVQSPIFGAWAIVRMALLGAVAGVGWGFAASSRVGCAGIAVLVYLFGMMAVGFRADVCSLSGFLCGAWLVNQCGAVIAIEHEAKLRGGFLAMARPAPPKALPLSAGRSAVASAAPKAGSGPAAPGAAPAAKPTA